MKGSSVNNDSTDLLLSNRGPAFFSKLNLENYEKKIKSLNLLEVDLSLFQIQRKQNSRFKLNNTATHRILRIA